MVSFTHRVKNNMGIHVITATRLADYVSRLTSDVFIELNGTLAVCREPLSILRLNAVTGDTVKVFLSGNDEQKEIEGLRQYMKNAI